MIFFQLKFGEIFENQIILYIKSQFCKNSLNRVEQYFK